MRRTLLELALADLVAFLRGTVDRNRRGDGSPSPAVAALAVALERFERLGGFEALNLELWRDVRLGSSQPAGADGSGALRAARAASRLPRPDARRPVADGCGRHRPPAAVPAIRR